MSAREWKPGDVAMLKCRDGVERIAILTDRDDLSPLWIAESVDWGRLHDDVPVRPLVVIDPEDAEAVERLRKSLETHAAWADDPTEGVAVALREFANPTPPRPEEPTGLGAVVVAGDGREWIHHGRGKWMRDDAMVLEWADLLNVRVLSEGWSK